MKTGFVSILGGLALAVCASACTGNGSLFDEVAASVDEPSEGTRTPEAPAPSGGSPAPDEDVPADGVMSPFAGNVFEGNVSAGNVSAGNVSAGNVSTGNVSNRPLPQPAESAPEPAPPPDQGPVILDVSPADGARGVANSVNIVILFSEPMDREATEAAYQSEDIPSGSVEFSWNEESTELTVVPQALPAYPTGPEPDLVGARRIDYFISASASDLEGRRLAQPYEFSFSLLRQIELTLFAVQDRDLSGSFRSNDTYGAGECARGEVNMCVGDARVAGANLQYKGFISFDLVDVPGSAADLSAVLSMEISDVAGNPFGGLGGLVLEHLSFDAIGTEAFDADALDEVGLIGEAGAAGTVLSADVSSAFAADQVGRGMSQYRLRFEEVTDRDVVSDALLSAWDTQTLSVRYLMP